MALAAGQPIRNSGSVRFASAPARAAPKCVCSSNTSRRRAAVGRLFAMLFGEEPEQQIREDLRRFKALMETGEVPLSEGTGLRRAAQPPRRVDTLLKRAGVSR